MSLLHGGCGVGAEDLGGQTSEDVDFKEAADVGDGLDERLHPGSGPLGTSRIVTCLTVWDYGTSPMLDEWLDASAGGGAARVKAKRCRRGVIRPSMLGIPVERVVVVD